MQKIILIMLIFTTISTHGYEKCQNITTEIDTKKRWDMQYDFKSRIADLKMNRQNPENNTYLKVPSQSNLDSFTVKAFVVSHDIDDAFDKDLARYFTMMDSNMRHLTYTKHCFIYNNDIKVVFLFTEILHAIEIKSYERSHDFTVIDGLRNVNTLYQLANIVNIYHTQQRQLVALMPDAFYITNYKDNIIKYMPLQSYQPNSAGMKRYIDNYLDPMIIRTDYKPKFCNDIYSLGMFMDSYIYGEISFSSIDECNSNIIKPLICITKRYEAVRDRHHTIEIYFGKNKNYIGTHKNIEKNIKKSMDKLIESMVDPVCETRPNSDSVKSQLYKIMLLILNNPKDLQYFEQNELEINNRLDANYTVLADRNFYSIIFPKRVVKYLPFNVNKPEKSKPQIDLYKTNGLVQTKKNAETGHHIYNNKFNRFLSEETENKNINRAINQRFNDYDDNIKSMEVL